MGVTAIDSSRKLKREGRNLSRSQHTPKPAHTLMYTRGVSVTSLTQRGDFRGHLTLMFLTESTRFKEHLTVIAVSFPLGVRRLRDRMSVRASQDPLLFLCF